jgi:hypothetical protein
MRENKDNNKVQKKTKMTRAEDPQLDDLLDRSSPSHHLMFHSSVADVLDEFATEKPQPAPSTSKKDNDQDAFMKELTAGMASMLANLESNKTPGGTDPITAEDPNMASWAEEFRRQLMTETSNGDASSAENTTDFQRTLEATMDRLHQSNERVSVCL